MPVGFFTEAERERLGRFPAEISPEELITYFTLTATDLAQVRAHRGEPNRLGFALQLSALRYLGFCPDDLTTAPSAVLTYLAQQLGTAPEALRDYGERAQTRTDHRGEIQAYLGFRDAGPAELDILASWLLERALEHDKPRLLFQLVVEKLYTDRWVRPGVTRLERLVAHAREQAGQETFHRLEPLLTPECRTLLDGLLQRDTVLGRTRLDWLRQGATANTPRAILGALAKLTYLREAAIDRWDLTLLNPNRRKFLAQLGRKSTNQALQRTPEARRYPILVAFLRQAVEELTDEVVDLYDRYLAQAYNRAGRELQEFRLNAARASNEKVRLFQELGQLVLDPAVTDAQLRAMIYERLPRERLEAAVAECDRLIRPVDDQYFDLLAQRYSTLRAFAPEFVAAFTFHANQATAPLLEAILLLRRLNAERRRKVPDETSLAFVSAKWLPYVVDPEGRIDRRSFELCVLWELRGALRAGNIWIEGSRRYANPETYLLPEEQWPALRSEACVTS